jgi:hypothetical protein
MAENIPIREIKIGSRSVPTLSVPTFIEHMVKQGRLSRLYGGMARDTVHENLQDFWKNFHTIRPSHFAKERFENGSMMANRTVPVYTHIDEGRGIFDVVFLNY